MDNRKYNIYFNTHTISGIIICAILYVMFFAGSFSFFKDDLASWQKNESHLSQEAVVKKDFNYVLDSLAKHHTLKGRDFDLTMQRHQASVYVSMSASHDPIVKKQKKPKRSRKEDVAAEEVGEEMMTLHFLRTISANIGKPITRLVIPSVNFCTGCTFWRN